MSEPAPNPSRPPWRRIFFHLLVWSIVAWCLAPFAWQVITSLKTEAAIARIPAAYLPDEITLHNYASLFARKPFARYLWNSFVISSASTALWLLTGALAAYSLTRLRIAGVKPISASLVAISLLPLIIFFFPLYELVRLAKAANHPVSLILPYVTFNLPFTILVLSAFFRTIPPDLEEAARMDGFSRLQILFKIILPLSAPALATTGILVFIACWNEFLLALTFMTDGTAKTVTAGIASLGGATGELPWGALSAAVVVSTLPLVALVAAFQKRIVRGLAAGSVKS